MTSNINKIILKNCIFDDIHVREDTSGIDLTPVKKDWKIDTYLLAKFEDNLEAGNVSLGGLIIDRWKVKRRRLDKTSYVELGFEVIEEGQDFHHIDYTNRSGVTYEYEIIPMSGDVEGEPKSIQVASELKYWWISDEYESYPLLIEFKPSSIRTNIQRNTYEGFDRFPKISYGNAKYKSGSIEAILLDKTLNPTYNYREKFENFINNQKKKYLKSRHGDLMIIDTFDSSQEILEIAITKNLASIVFNYVEVELPKEE